MPESREQGDVGMGDYVSFYLDDENYAGKVADISNNKFLVYLEPTFHNKVANLYPGALIEGPNSKNKHFLWIEGSGIKRADISMREKIANTKRDPFVISHRDLISSDDESPHRKKCPECNEGGLYMQRDVTKFTIRKDDQCFHCGARFIYSDISGNDVLLNYMYTTVQLMEALKEGKLLERPDPQSPDEIMYFFSEVKGMLEAKGWGSGTANSKVWLEDIFHYPERWRLSDHAVKDYPWSLEFKKKHNMF